jgi:hypothetical protein
VLGTKDVACHLPDSSRVQLRSTSQRLGSRCIYIITAIVTS